MARPKKNPGTPTVTRKKVYMVSVADKEPVFVRAESKSSAIKYVMHWIGIGAIEIKDDIVIALKIEGKIQDAHGTSVAEGAED